MTKILSIRVDDVRFPTSRQKHGSDAMNPDPDYSAAYVTLQTDSEHVGCGIVFTLGRGTELCAAAIRAYADKLVGQQVEDLMRHPGRFWRTLVGDSQLRWLGPEKGIVHMATAALVNAVWDLWAKLSQRPLWRLLAEMSPEQLVDCVDFRYLTDVLTPDEALEILRRQAPTRQQRIDDMLVRGYPAYTTSAGWLGYSDDEIRRRCRAAVADGWQAMKLKVGADLEQDRHRLRLVRAEIGPHIKLMIDANQVWDVPQAIQWMRELAEFDLYWIEEPTSPDDILGHAEIARQIAPTRVATGEMIQNRVVFKQLMQAGAIHFCQLDSCRLGGVNEVLAVLLLAAKFQIPVCPHGGGVGLCEHIVHLSLFDYIAVSGSLQDRWTEYVDHLHEHFMEPVEVVRGRYQPPKLPGYSIEMRPESVAMYQFPDGPVWSGSDEGPGIE
ncbi:MAG: L-fuconate dehydratase [Planctomycetales bacterium]|nr:L-fuconate dehydratase [Planctomycetales bacterium]